MSAKRFPILIVGILVLGASAPCQSSQGASTSASPPARESLRGSQPAAPDHELNRHPPTKHPAVSPENKDEPKKIVVHDGGASEPAAQLVTAMAPEEVVRGSEATEQSLETTAQTLRELAGRTLSDEQEETVSQIQNYMRGAKTAEKEGDVSRAKTLALKAKLLADDLVKH